MGVMADRDIGGIRTEPGRPQLNRLGIPAEPGPWWGEPDRVDWIDPGSGLPCRARRGPFGAWCGYVGLLPGHPWYDVDYDDLDVEVHGGLTFGGRLSDAPEAMRWVGFDCAHAGDYTPGLVAKGFPSYPGEVYRDLAYVEAEIRKLAEQLGRATPVGILGWARVRG